MWGTAVLGAYLGVSVDTAASMSSCYCITNVKGERRVSDAVGVAQGDRIALDFDHLGQAEIESHLAAVHVIAVGIFAGVVKGADVAREGGQGATAVYDRDIAAYEMAD